MERLSGELSVTKRVNTLPSQELYDQQQYQRRSCIIIDGINHDEHETDITSKAKNVLNKYLQINKVEIEKQINKCPRIAPKNENNSQATILKFKSHSLRLSVYHSIKKIKNRKIKSNISPSKKWGKVLSYAHQAIASIPNVDFLHADINGYLKL